MMNYLFKYLGIETNEGKNIFEVDNNIVSTIIKSQVQSIINYSVLSLKMSLIFLSKNRFFFKYLFCWVI